ncbi:hypothetical protein D521_1215 [beta proteobacterium CB]|nr:hypothetical protein D521_1215 [beta proteobacterium CB]
MIEQKKLEFLQKYNPTHSIVVAQSKAISASVQHNKLYSSNLDLTLRRKIRDSWKAELASKAEKYVNSQSVSQFEIDFISLQSTMNNLYRGNFLSYHKGGNGFRVSHAQKSLSIYLKHLWCLGRIFMPPICPIDNVVLRLTEAKGVDATWTFVNSLDEHKKRFTLIENEARKNKLPIAEWEILNFKV